MLESNGQGTCQEPPAWAGEAAGAGAVCHQIATDPRTSSVEDGASFIPFTVHRYSRMLVTGSIRDARRAGMPAATSATTPSSSTTPPNTSGSVAVTP